MKVFATNKLTHTFQTHLGMIIANGEPHSRIYPFDAPKDLAKKKGIPVSQPSLYNFTEEEVIALFTRCVLEYRLPSFQDSSWECDVNKHFKANIYACCHASIDIEFMKGIVISRTGMDLEQAAAVVISAIRNDSDIADREKIVGDLIQVVEYDMLMKSCMWQYGYYVDKRVPASDHRFRRFVKFFGYLIADTRSEWCTNSYSSELGTINSWSQFLPILLRVRRAKPRSRGLFIPEWVFNKACCEAPAEYKVWNSEGLVKPGHEPTAGMGMSLENHIILSRRNFRFCQRRLLNYRRFWEPAILLREAIEDLESNVLYAEDIRSKVLSTQDTLVVAHYFFALQRRLQRKVVSSLGSTGFLEKGETANVMQNNSEIQSTFEQRLSDFSGQTGVPVSGPLIPQIDQCCLLMERYVNLYGAGDRKNLVFSLGVQGGSGRGPIDDYNLLCEILKILCKAANGQGIAHPGAVRKFLAKDIMAWNQSFDDDAFANGRVPGWETWLAQRREDGLVQEMRAVQISSDDVMDTQ